MWKALAIVCACVAPVSITVAAEVPPDTMVLENAFVSRILKLDDGVWRTVRFARADGTDPLDVRSEEFRIRLPDGSELTARDYRCAGKPRIWTEEDVLLASVRYEPRRELSSGAPTEVVIEYRVANEPYLRKQLCLTMSPGGTVDRLEVERFQTKQPCARGGRGEPVFIGPSWFVGLEYPGSETKHADGVVTLAHFPGLAQKDGADGLHMIRSKTAVAGIGNPGNPIGLAFSDYLDTIRRPSRILLHYNSWYDLRQNELTLDALVGTFEAFKKSVLDPYNLRMDVFVPDDGWQNPQSIWVPRDNLYPQGLGPLAQALESRETRLGLWLPFNGFNLDVSWGAKQGYEKSDQGRYYCLAGRKYNAAIRNVVARLIEEGNIGYFKHDFNQLQCSAEGHAHVPDARHGHEANLDAELELLALERRLQPDIFLNVTSYVWHSPWWLMHADTIWMVASDFGYNHDWPQLSPREWAMSYRDAHFYKLYTERSTLVPLSAMMTHGIIHGRYQLLGGKEETLREWSDYVVMYYGRGVQLMEWYITPALMTSEQWKVLGRATRWAIQNRGVLQNVVLVGGDPRKGRPYGYAHWSGDRGILVLRNPDVREGTINVPFDKSVRYRGDSGKTFQGRVIYPFIETLPGKFVSGQPVQVSVPGCSVMVCELAPFIDTVPGPVAAPPPPDATCKVLQAQAGHDGVAARVAVPDEKMQRCDLYFIIRSQSKAMPPALITLDGQAVNVREGGGPGWLIYSVDLRRQTGQKVDVALALGDANAPFSRADRAIAAWLVMDRAVAEAENVPSERWPLPVSTGFRRQTVELLGETGFERRTGRHSLTTEQLKNIKAAKLRIVVFDSNGEPRYRDKFIHLNGEKFQAVPANTGPLSVWQQHVIDLPAEHLARLRLTNQVEVTNPAGDYFKFTGLSLALQLADGTWVETRCQTQVYSSTEQWHYAEGTPFIDARSGVITLGFE
ncbi:MAG: hypothetical protein JSV19_00285 [Phycisphaerales bacterium]|nr:MAG: hypothetical protein JSV19_00285 [Phycisphaerales bacterium]